MFVIEQSFSFKFKFGSCLWLARFRRAQKPSRAAAGAFRRANLNQMRPLRHPGIALLNGYYLRFCEVLTAGKPGSLKSARGPYPCRNMSEHVFVYTHRVTYADCTAGNHVYYSRYLDLFEAARGEFFRHFGTPLLELQNHGFIFPVVECRLRYKKPARYDEVLRIEVELIHAAGVRLTFPSSVLNAAGNSCWNARLSMPAPAWTSGRGVCLRCWCEI